LEKEIKKNGHAIRKVPAILKRGQVAFHQASTIHGSGPNHSSKARRAYGVHMQPISNQPVPNAFHFNKMLCSENGKINYADPFWFPLLGEICS
ncbi:MAG: phytanoyl-CoA dioxygenase family protein, partial [Pseudobdellovibrio sp.]